MLNQHAIASQQIGDVFQYGKLDKGYHAPLVNEITRFAEEAGVAPRDVSGADYHLTDFEISYLKAFHKQGAQGRAGLLYIGDQNPPTQARMKSTAGALLRNYISARFMLRDELVYELWDRKRRPDFDMVLVPDLSVMGLNDAPKRAVAAWLVRRISRGQQTAVGVPNAKVLADLLGSDAPYLKNHFLTLNGVQDQAA